jgi:glycosyltransferase involved in cell wall biosynthesis
LRAEKLGQKRILVYFENLVSPGGAERVAIEEAKYFAERCETLLVTFGVSDAVLSYARGKMPPLRVLKDSGDASRTTDFGNRVSVFVTLRRTVRLWSAIRAFKPDVILSSIWGGWIALYLATLISRIPYVLHVHGTTYLFNEGLGAAIKYSFLHRSVFDELSSSTPGHVEFIPRKRPRIISRPSLELLAFLDSAAVRRASQLIVVSDRGGREVRGLYGRAAIKLPITEIPKEPLVAKSGMKQQLGLSGRRILLSVSRLERIKRVDVLIKAFALVAPEFQDAKLVVVGDGSELDMLTRLAENLGVSQRIMFTRFVTDELLPEYYLACDAFVYAGWSDFVLTIYEALAANKPVICSSEIEPEAWMLSTGLLRQANPDAASFADGIRNTLSERRVLSSGVRKPNMDDYLSKVLEICLRSSRD